MASDTRIIKTYVWHGDECFFVSTVERDSSACDGPRRFFETMVWLFNWETNERGEWVHQDGCGCLPIKHHMHVAERFYEYGQYDIPEDQLNTGKPIGGK